jgi:hypothetical protein
MATKKTTGKKLADMMYGNPEGAAFGITPMIGKRREDRQDREAAKSFPVDLARGVAAGFLGMPGDIESLARLPYELITGNESPTFLPTSEDVLKRIPFGTNTPAGQFASGLGTLAGGSANLGAIPRAVKAAPGALKTAARNLSTPSTLNPQAGVIKMKGGNWLGGSIEKALEELKRPDRMTGGRKDPSESLAEMKARYTPEAIEELPPELRGTVLAGIQDLEKKVALNNWVDSNLYGYIKNDMATPQDPVRLMIERRMAEIDQKFAKDMERVRRVEQRAAAEADPRRKANFDRQAQTARAEAEAERDTAVKYASHMPQNEIDYANQWIPEDLALTRMRAGFPTEGLGQSNAAKGWEAITDTYINTAPASEYTKPLTETEARRGLKSVVDDNPWLSKLDPDTQVQYLKNADSISQDLRLDHIMDVLREDVATGRIRPEQLNKVSMEQAVRRTAEYDQELAAKMAQARIAQREGLPVYKDYPEGYRWVELNKPGTFASESEAMGHSVRGYEPPKGHPDWVEGSGDRGSLGYGVGGWEGIKSGKAKIYSLVDSKGEPHVTVEVESGKPWNERSGIFYDNPELEPSWQKFSQEASLEEKAKGLDRPSNYIERYPEWLKANDPEVYEKHAKVFEQGPSRVRQIKGKGNDRPVDKYDPFTQDFVKSGQWSEVRDLENTGLIEAGGKYVTQDEAKAEFVPRMQKAMEFLRTNPAFEEQRAARMRRDKDMFKLDFDEQANLESIYGEPVYPGSGYSAVELLRILEEPDAHVSSLNNYYRDISGWVQEAEKAMKHYEPPPEGMARGGRVYFSDNPDVMQLELAKGGAIRMQAGGLAKAAKAAAKALKPAEAPMKASEALGRIEGRPLVITQADRTKVGGGFLGGPGFSGLQLEDPAYRAAEAAWAVKNPGTAKMILGGRGDSKDAVYAAMLGTPTQHQSNQMVFDKLLGDFKKAAKKGGLDPDLRDRINMRLANSVDKDGNKIFPPEVDILDKNFKDLASTFDRRAVTANLIGGMGVGGKKGQIIDYDKIIRQTTDPMLLESPTGALGNRLFTLSGGVIERPDLHPAFPTIMQGEDLGVSFDPVARELIMKDFMEKTMREKGRAPGIFDYTRGYPPSQLITEDLLTGLQKMGKKAGGEVKAPAAQIDGNKFVLAAQKYGLGDDMTTLNKMVSLVNMGATVDEAARVVAGGVRKAGGGEVHGLSTADLLYLQSQEDLGKLPAHAQREAITNMGGQEVRQRMAGKMAAGGEITADDLILEERKL